MSSFRRCGALVLAGLVAMPASARAADPRAAEVPLAVPVAEVSRELASSDLPESTGPIEHVSSDISKGAGTDLTEGPAPPPGASLRPGASLQGPTGEIEVAIGLGPTAPGTRPERLLLAALERSVTASTAPRVRLRHLRPGVGEGKQVCRARRDDLVILVEYLPDRADPVLLAHDCRLDRALGVRGADAASHPELIPALWAEHDDLVGQGARERRRGQLGPKVRTGLIVGGAILAVGVAIGVVVAASLRREIVVLTVSP